ncbi:MAG: 50S ribosomal protein L5 [Candidatus Pacearchaeota archaeon]
MNPMREINIEKVVLSVGGVGEKLERGFKLLKYLTGRKPIKVKTFKRIPSFEIRPRLEVGAMVTIRRGAYDILRRMLAARDNTLSKKSVSENTLSFGIKEYIEIPETEYQREIGILGLDVTISFARKGKRLALKKRGRGKIPEKQRVAKEEIIKFMENTFKTKFV